MKTLDDLIRLLRSLEGRGYPSYKQIAGSYGGPGFVLSVDWVQGDPFAEPSRLRAMLTAGAAALPDWALATRTRRLATADFLNRAFGSELEIATRARGSGRSGELRILEPGQEILDRSSLRVTEDGQIEVRFRAGLPARGRTILGREAADLLGGEVVAAMERGLRFPALDGGAMRRHVETVEDARALRDQLAGRGLVAFVADGARLPRRSGVDDRPLDAEAVPFRSPDTMRVVLEAPNAGLVAGMGVPAGVTLIAGGGFHGKSTLLRAIERGVYDHVPGDGRERVVTVGGAVKVRAEDGRAVAGVDISNFVGALPGGGDTHAFRTTNASGSTSQAAAIVEALEVGATCLLLDEDTSATNLLIRDARVQALVPASLEPITPFIDRARQLADGLGVSTILVVGGSGDYFDVADTVIAMLAYAPADRTLEAKRIAAEHPTRRRAEGGAWRPIAPRIPLPASLDPRRGRRDVHIRAFAEERILFGTEEVDLGAVEQIVETAQVRAIAEAIVWARGGVIDGRRPLAEALGLIMDALNDEGLDTFQHEPTGESSAFRVFELAAVLGRIRSLRTSAPHPH